MMNLGVKITSLDPLERLGPSQGPHEVLKTGMCVCVCVCVCFIHHIVQVDVGSSPDEFLYDLQTSLFSRQHQRSLTVLSTNKHINTF